MGYLCRSFRTSIEKIASGVLIGASNAKQEPQQPGNNQPQPQPGPNPSQSQPTNNQTQGPKWLAEKWEPQRAWWDKLQEALDRQRSDLQQPSNNQPPQPGNNQPQSSNNQQQQPGPNPPQQPINSQPQQPGNNQPQPSNNQPQPSNNQPSQPGSNQPQQQWRGGFQGRPDFIQGKDAERWDKWEKRKKAQEAFLNSRPDLRLRPDMTPEEMKEVMERRSGLLWRR